MVRIRYSELPAGLHVSAERHGDRTTIYLLPGLTAAERKAALARVRSSGRLGHGPPLPTVAMAVAIGLDQVRTTLRNGAFAMRSHPVLLLPPLILLVSSAIVFVFMSFVTVTIRPLRPQASGPQPNAVIGTRPQPAVGIGAGSSPAHQRGGNAGQPGAGKLTPSTAAGGGTSGSPHSSSGPSGSPHRSPAPTPPSPGPPTPSPTPSASPSSHCVNVGGLPLCVNL
jgi:hypothetical protein